MPKTVICATKPVKWLMLLIESEHKIYYCPIKGNRNINEISNIEVKYQRVDSLTWTDEQKRQDAAFTYANFLKGILYKLFTVLYRAYRLSCHECPKAHIVDEIEKICAVRWRIEQCHRELKQTTGLERCQCRKAQIQRNHIACCLLVWHRLKALAIQFKSNIYQLKQDYWTPICVSN